MLGEKKKIGSVMRDEMLRFRGGGPGGRSWDTWMEARTDAMALFIVRICVDK